MNKFLLTIATGLFLSTGTTVHAQPGGQPDIPGAIVIDVAGNVWQGAPTDMALKSLGSLSVNVYYQLNFPIGSSKFALLPAFGVGLEKYGFDQNITLVTSPDDQTTSTQPVADLLPDASSIKKTNFAANYFDVPIELRYYLNNDNRRKSVKFSAGGKVGVLIDAHTKIKYRENNKTKFFKQKENYNLNRLRYGVYGKVGVAGFSLFYYYSISEIFQNKQGPEETRVQTQMVGISLRTF